LLKRQNVDVREVIERQQFVWIANIERIHRQLVIERPSRTKAFS
jgi:hypothetical protein